MRSLDLIASSPSPCRSDDAKNKIMTGRMVNLMSQHNVAFYTAIKFSRCVKYKVPLDSLQK